MALSLSPVAFIEGIGGPEMGLIIIIVLVLFGGKKLPEFARGLGKSIREFKKAASGVEQEFKRALDEDEQNKYTPPPSLPAASSTPELMPAADYHDDPYHSDPHYGHDGSEAGPSGSVTPEPAPTDVVAADGASSAPVSLPGFAAPTLAVPAIDVPAPKVPAPEVTPPVTPPVAPPTAPASEAKP
jgi:sec-independent protein translocase protein TatA